jgi:hypothetical protein
LFEKVAKGGELTIESAKNQDSYKIMVERLANTIAPDNNPRAQISVLADNGVLTPYYYKTDQEYKAIKEQQINDLRQLKIDAGATDISLTEKELYDIEISLVRKVQDGNGLFMPVLTDEQKKLARERVKESIDIQLAEQIQKDMPNIGRGGGTTTKNKVTDASLYTTLASAWNSGDISVLNDQLRNEKYKIKTITDKSGKSLGRAVVEVKGDTEIQLTKPTDNLFDLRTYFFGTGPNAEEEAIKQRKAWLAGGKATTSTKGNQSAGAGDSIFKS